MLYGKTYTYKETWYKYICNNCGWTAGQMSRNNLLSNHQGCACCHSLVVVRGINDIPTTNPWMIPYFPGGEQEASLYTAGSTKKIKFKCPECEKIKTKPITINYLYRNKSINCTCSDGISYPEKFIINMFDQLNVKYIHQLTNRVFTWVTKYRYDFYLPHYNCILEIHGMQHYTNCNYTDRTVEEEIKNDEYKKQLAFNNGITNYIELDCRYSNCEYIKNSILCNDFLLKILDIDKCNWEKCDIYAHNSLFIKACNLKKENPTYSTAEIGKILHLHPGTIRKYLKQGNIYKLCNYNVEEERLRSRTKDNKGAYEINILNKDSNDIIKTYASAKNLSENSINDFGIYFEQEQARHAAKYNKIYKGYKFKYTKDIA